MTWRTETLAEGVRPSHLPRDIVTIYGLCDPATGELRYVGKTRYEPERRLTYHMTRCHRERVASGAGHYAAWACATARTFSA